LTTLRMFMAATFSATWGMQTNPSRLLDEPPESANSQKVNARIPLAVELAARAAQLQHPRAGLEAVSALRRQLDVLESLHVENALTAGLTWSSVAAALGVSKQAAHGRHARKLRTRPTKPHVGRAEPAKVLVAAEARRSVAFSREEAGALGSPVVGTEHLLLGLLRDAAGLPAQALSVLGISIDHARDRVEQLGGRAAPRGRSASSRLPLSKRARETLEQSLREAVDLGHQHLGSEHILRALVRDEKSGASRTLTDLGMSAEAVLEQLEVKRSSA
jgi:hypothetical protein